MSISLVSPLYEPCVYRSLHFIISGKDAALDAAHSLKTDTDCKLYGMGVSLGESCFIIFPTPVATFLSDFRMRMSEPGECRAEEGQEDSRRYSGL